MYINRIVIDHELRTCVNKDTGYDLLNPLSPPKHTCQWDWKKEVIKKLKYQLPAFKEECDARCEPVRGIDIVAAVQRRIEQLVAIEDLQRRDAAMKKEFEDCFPSDIPPIEHLPDDVVFRVQPKDANKIIQRCSYDCPKKYREAWKTLLQQHIDAGRLRPSNSSHSSPAFIIPKANPTALPRWVNDFRQLNLNTIPDNHPLPKIDEILRDCAKGEFFAKIDMTNTFFQTKVRPDDTKWLAVHTPWGLYEWLVMPMGVRNAPAVHQWRMTSALRHLIGRICHVYLDDIIIWSQTLEEHIQNVRTMLQALRDAKLFCSLKKTQLFCTEVLFLGHKVSNRGIEADPDKVARILDWPVPRSASETRSFLGLVRYIADHIPNLAEHTRVLNALTTKAAELSFPPWTTVHQDAFQAIKDLVTSPCCLTTIDHDNPGDNKIFLTCDASDYRTGAVLAWGPLWEEAKPVAFDSTPLRDAALNYPVHEKELLAIIRRLKKWRIELLGAPLHVYTDHCTLQNFATQRDLSRRQARWQEYMAQFDLTIHYVKGERNVVADALSRRSDEDPTHGVIAAVSTNTLDRSLVLDILTGYTEDPFCHKLLSSFDSIPGLVEKDGLLYLADRLIVPRVRSLREKFFQIAHDAAGHFGADKTYAVL